MRLLCSCPSMNLPACVPLHAVSLNPAELNEKDKETLLDCILVWDTYLSAGWNAPVPGFKTQSSLGLGK